MRCKKKSYSIRVAVLFCWTAKPGNSRYFEVQTTSSASALTAVAAAFFYADLILMQLFQQNNFLSSFLTAIFNSHFNLFLFSKRPKTFFFLMFARVIFT